MNKPWYLSRGVVGGMVSILAGILTAFGLEVDQPALTDTALAAAEVIGGAVAVYGRIKATQPVRWR